MLQNVLSNVFLLLFIVIAIAIAMGHLIIVGATTMMSPLHP
jgi:hypothetical protein